MASHAGLIYVLETKDGYIDEKGKIATKIEEAKKIDFLDFGFGPSALEVFRRLGFENSELGEDDIRFFSVIPPYEARVDKIASFYKKLGMDFEFALEEAHSDYITYSLSNNKNYLKYIDLLEKKVIDFFERKPVDELLKTNDQTLELHQIKNNTYQREESTIDYFYSKKGQVYRYSLELKNPQIEKYFNLNEEEIKYWNEWQNKGLINYLEKRIQESKYQCYLGQDFQILDKKIEEGKLKLYFQGASRGISNLVDLLNQSVRDYYSKKELHITRMFGSYILLQNKEGELKAVKATPVPIKYCPLMVKLLKEVGGTSADTLLETLKTEDEELQTKMMCNLINEIVIQGGYFDTNRPLNSCEANVLFGASETISSAFKGNLIDAAVIVSNNLGTIITTNDSNTQGAVKRMTGLFYTSPSEKLVTTAVTSKIIPVFPYTAKIDQVAGVKEAIKRGYKRIAVSVAASDNYLLKELKELETDGVILYKFGLCSTGIDEKTALIMKENADVVWSCASKYVKQMIEPVALAQVGIKIPVHVMTEKGWKIVKNHLSYMDFEDPDLEINNGEDKPVILNEKGKMKVLTKKEIHNCTDCPHPCV